MSSQPQTALLADGERLHLQHGPIDLIIGVDPSARAACFAAAIARFDTLLSALVQDLAILRRPVAINSDAACPVARRMTAAVRPFDGVFVTPMAAVAGAVADEILDHMVAAASPAKAWVNNGGDIALYLAHGHDIVVRSASGDVRFDNPGRFGVATSGWRGRSQSFGIADAVTVVANSAASADVAATLVANAVDLPGHPGITRRPARELAPDSDLGDRPVTTAVADLSQGEADKALADGLGVARDFKVRGLIADATLSLAGRSCGTVEPCPLATPAPAPVQMAAP